MSEVFGPIRKIISSPPAAHATAVCLGPLTTTAKPALTSGHALTFFWCKAFSAFFQAKGCESGRTPGKSLAAAVLAAGRPAAREALSLGRQAKGESRTRARLEVQRTTNSEIMEGTEEEHELEESW